MENKDTNYVQEVKQTDAEKIKMYQETCTFDELIKMHIHLCLAYRYIPKTVEMYRKSYSFEELAKEHIKLTKQGMNPMYLKSEETDEQGR